MPILLKFWNSLGVDSRYLSQIAMKLYASCLLCHFGMFFMQLWGKLTYLLARCIILDIAEVETPTWRATSVNAISYFSTNPIAIRPRTADTFFRRLPEVNSTIETFSH